MKDIIELKRVHFLSNTTINKTLNFSHSYNDYGKIIQKY